MALGGGSSARALNFQRLRPLMWTVFAALATSTSARAVDGEVCGPQNPFRNGCAANQDYMLVVDASSSIALVWDEYIAFLRSFVQGFDLNPNDPSSPRIGLISFYGFPGQICDMNPHLCARCELDGEGDRGCVTSDLQVLDAAIKALEPPPPGVLTCISCGMDLAEYELGHAASSSRGKPLMILLTDGDQTAGGTESKAIALADGVKRDFATVVTIGINNMDESVAAANIATLKDIASDPPELYYRETRSVDDALREVGDIISDACLDVEYVCHMDVHCNEFVDVAIHGSGFFDAGGSSLKCRVNGGPPQPATYYDQQTMRCATSVNPISFVDDHKDGVDITVELSFDGGVHWTRLSANAEVNIPCLSPPSPPPKPPPSPPPPSPRP